MWFFFFFFQAEDGIRDVAVTGVQTCALPISTTRGRWPARARDGRGQANRRSRPDRPRACAGAVDRRGDVVQIRVGQFKTRGADPAVDLCRGSRADDRASHTGPGKGPGDGDRGYAAAVTLGDRPQGLREPEIAA